MNDNYADNATNPKLVDNKDFEISQYNFSFQKIFRRQIGLSGSVVLLT